NPAFDAEYAESYPVDFNPEIEETWTIFPAFEEIILGITCLLIRKADLRFIVIIKSHSFSSSSTTLLPPKYPPTTLTKIWISLYFFNTWETKFFSWSSLPRSALINSIRDFTCSSSPSIFGLLTYVEITLALQPL